MAGTWGNPLVAGVPIDQVPRGPSPNVGGPNSSNDPYQQVYNRPTPPGLQAIKNRLSNLNTPIVRKTTFDYSNTPYQPGAGYQAGPSYQERDYSGSLPEYDYLRGKTTQDFNSQNQQQQDAMARRFAAIGGLNTGSYIKQAGLQDQQNSQQRSDALLGIGAQEAEARRGLQEQEHQRSFASNEAEKQRGYAASESERQRGFTANEDLNQRNLQKSEFLTNYGTSVDQINAGLKQSYDQFGIQAGSSLEQLDLAWRDSLIQAMNDSSNKDLQQWQMQHGGLNLFNLGWGPF